LRLIFSLGQAQNVPSLSGKRGDPYYITDSGMSVIRSYHRDLKHQREKLSNYPETINELPDSSSPTIKLSPPLYKGEIDSRESDSNGWRSVDTGDDLFSEDDTTSESLPAIEQPAARALGAAASAPKDYMALDWEYLNKRYDAQDMAAIGTHCGMRQIDPQTVIAQIEAERGIQEQADEDE
jgi:hypothetical protein